MNAKQRRKAWRLLTKLRRDRTPVLAPPVYFYDAALHRPRVITTVSAVFRDAGVAHLTNDKNTWPRPVAAHNIKPVPRCWRGNYAHD